MRLFRGRLRTSDLAVIAAAALAAVLATGLLMRSDAELAEAAKDELLISDLLRRENDLYDLSYALLNGYAHPANVRWVERDVAQSVDELARHHRHADIDDVLAADADFRRALSTELDLIAAGESRQAADVQRRSVFAAHRALARETAATTTALESRRAALRHRINLISVVVAFVAALGIALVVLLSNRNKRVRDEAQRARLASDNQRLRDQKAVAELIQQIARAADMTSSVDRLLERTIGHMCFYAGWPLGHVWRPGADGVLEPTGIWHCEEPGRFRTFRRATKELGASVEDTLPRRAVAAAAPVWLDDLGASDLPRAAAARADGLTTGLAVPIVAHGEIISVLELFTDRPLPSHRALVEITNALATQLGDIVERKAADVERRRLAAIVASSGDSMLTTTADGLITSWNPAAVSHSGYSVEDVLGMPVVKLFPEDRRADFGKLLAMLERGEPVHNFELKLRKRSGELADISVTVTPLGQEGGFSITSRDVTELKQAQARYRTLVEHLPMVTYVDQPKPEEDGFWSASYISPQVQTMLGYTAEEWDALQYTTLIHPDDRARVIGAHEESYANLLDFDEEYRVLHKDGRTVWVRDAMSFIRDDAGAALFAQGYMLDITSRKAYEQELDRLLAGERAQNEKLRELDRLKDEFVALVSHELRTPLTSIRGYLELVLDGQAGDLSDEQTQFLGVVERNADRLQRLVGDLLFIAQVDAGRLALEFDRFDAATVAAEAVEAAEPVAADKQIELVLSGDASAELVGDRARLGQLLDNLISNALKFTPNGGRVEVAVAIHGAQVSLEVSDTGMGIPSDEQERLFQRFFRTAAATSQAIPGTGLGLAISKAIVDAHDGSIELESEAGRGTTFRISIPTDIQVIEEAA
jgi:PAS domain S-box-containing protein